ncbi:MAG: hypothetical protein RR206_04895 [Bacteroidaceae bacterium]
MAEIKNCIELADIDAAISCADLDNLAGLVQELIYGYWEDVATFPDMPSATADSALSLEVAGAWDGDLTMKAGCRAYRAVFTEDSGEFSITDQGEKGGESFLYALTVVRARMSKVLFGFENATKGRRLFLIVKDKNGNNYLMGDALNACHKVAGEGSTTGKAASELNRSALKFEYSCPRKLIYVGDVSKILTIASPGV